MKLLAAAALFCLAAPCRLSAKTVSGADVLAAQNFTPFEGKRIGLITNHTAINSGGIHTAELFARAGNFKLAALFSPEHGFSGVAAHGEKVGDSVFSGIPVRSLYGKTKRPDFAMLRDIDILVFDIADAGARFYTYLSTMLYAMEEADKYGVPFFVLDRPNPVSGTIMEGPLLAPDTKAFTAYMETPVRHGMTAGEIALLHAGLKKLRLKPEIIRMKGWKRKMWFDETGLQWVNPSPNIRGLEAEILYSGIGCFEAANVSVGRGTDSPFLWIGAPWMSPERIIAVLPKKLLSGIKLAPEDRTPDSDLYAGKLCHGISIRITDRRKARPLGVFVAIACALRDLQESAFEIRWDEMRLMTGNGIFEELYKEGKPAQEIIAAFDRDRRPFESYRKKYLLY